MRAAFPGINKMVCFALGVILISGCAPGQKVRGREELETWQNDSTFDPVTLKRYHNGPPSTMHEAISHEPVDAAVD